MQDEVIRFVESVMRPLDFSEDAFALAEIEEVGPRGTFIDRMHTVEHFRRELWFPRLLDRDYYDAWLGKGGTSMEDRCCQRKEEILATHTPEPISGELDRTLGEIIAAARRELV